MVTTFRAFNKSVLIKPVTLADAPTFAKINKNIWNTPVSRDIIEYFNKGIFLFKEGYYLAEINGTIAFPIKEKLAVSELNTLDDPVDLYNPNGKIYYIHIPD